MILDDRFINVAHCIAKEPAGGVANFLMNLDESTKKNNIQCFYIFGSKNNKGKFEKYLIKNNRKYLKYNKIIKSGFFYELCSIRKFIKDNKIDVIHIHSPIVLGFFKLICIGLNVKTVVHSHSTKFSDTYLKSVRNYILFSFFKFSNYTGVACSYSAGEHLFGKNNNFKIFENAIPIQKYRFSEIKREKIRKQYGIENSCLVLICVANFFPVKNHIFLIGLMDSLIKKNQNFVLFLLGEGPEENEINFLIKEKSLEKNVIKISNVESDGIVNYLSASDLFILPSKFEGVPLSVIEAQANGLRCILSERVSKDVKLLDSTLFLDIYSDYQAWETEILNGVVNDRTRLSINDFLKASDYNISNQFEKLMKIYGFVDTKNV